MRQTHHILPYLVSFTPENRLSSHLVAFKLVLQLVQLLLEVLGAGEEERGREVGKKGGRKGGREGGKKGGREGGRRGRREEGKEGGGEEEKEGGISKLHTDAVS